MLTRRHFARLAATSSAALAFAPRSFAQTKRIRYAMVGLGRISLDHFMPACRQSAMSEVTALVSGHPEKARKAAAQYNVPESSIYTYENFDRIRDNPNVDAVYIALPNGMHAEYTIRAAQAGKHVLCEKPMANTHAEAEAMVAACEKAKVKLMVGYRCQLEPVVLHARKLIQTGALGTIEAVEGAFGFNIAAGEWRLTRKLGGGGPLMDVGVYPLNTARFLLGEEPSHFAANASVIDHDGRFNEVEENISWTMKFPSGVVGSCSATYGANMPGMIRVHGSKGTLSIEPAYSYDDTHLTGHLNGVAKGDRGTALDDLMQGRDPIQFRDEADYFAHCILTNAEVGPSGKEGALDMKWIGEIYKAAGLPA